MSFKDSSKTIPPQTSNRFSAEDKFKVLTLATQVLHDELKLQFQRLSFFLTGTALLFTAFAVVVTSDQFTNPAQPYYIIWTAYIINGLGFIFAFFFALVNYFNSTLITGVYENGLSIENSLLDSLQNFEMPLHSVNTSAENIKQTGELLLLWHMFRDLWHFLQSPLQCSSGILVPHTWLVPLGFAYVWFIVLLSVLLPLWYIPAGILGLFLLSVVTTLIVHTIKRQPSPAKQDVPDPPTRG